MHAVCIWVHSVYRYTHTCADVGIRGELVSSSSEACLIHLRQNLSLDSEIGIFC